jgi:hypothetical protein
VKLKSTKGRITEFAKESMMKQSSKKMEVERNESRLVEMAYGRVSGLVDTVFVILKNIK